MWILLILCDHEENENNLMPWFLGEKYEYWNDGKKKLKTYRFVAQLFNFAL